MTPAQFKATLAEAHPPTSITGSLSALWYAGKGDWERAHHIAQDIPAAEGSWVQAYLHRQEGDTGNARYWYNQAGKKMPDLTLEEEWEEIVKVLL